MKRLRLLGAASVCALLVGPPAAMAQGEHAGHGAGGEIYGRVHFPISCSAAVQADFDRAVAMLHSFF